LQVRGRENDGGVVVMGFGGSVVVRGRESGDVGGTVLVVVMVVVEW
jgi:hypothetical protein